MSSVANEKKEERARIFETVLSSPGMSEACKIVLNPTRQTIVVLCRLLEKGMDKNGDGKGDEILSFLPAESLSELQVISDELLKKSGLADFYQRLKML
jgi:hypothetical protein